MAAINAISPATVSNPAFTGIIRNSAVNRAATLLAAGGVTLGALASCVSYDKYDPKNLPDTKATTEMTNYVKPKINQTGYDVPIKDIVNTYFENIEFEKTDDGAKFSADFKRRMPVGGKLSGNIKTIEGNENEFQGQYYFNGEKSDYSVKIEKDEFSTNFHFDIKSSGETNKCTITNDINGKVAIYINGEQYKNPDVAMYELDKDMQKTSGVGIAFFGLLILFTLVGVGTGMALKS